MDVLDVVWHGLRDSFLMAWEVWCRQRPPRRGPVVRRDLGDRDRQVAVPEGRQLIVDAIFGALGLIPIGPRPTRADIFSTVQVDYKLALNLLGFAFFTALFWLTKRRGATDPVCGMTVDRDKAVTVELRGNTYYFCSDHCRHAFEADQVKDQRGGARALNGRPAHAQH